MKKLRFLCCIAIGASLLLTACRKGGSSTGGGDSVPVEDVYSNAAAGREWVYVPETVTIEDADADYGNMQLVGDRLCYLSMGREGAEGVRGICQYSLGSNELTKAPIDYPADGDICEIGFYVFGQDFVWAAANVYSSDYSQLRRFLYKFGLEGKNLISREVTEQIGKETTVRGMASDAAGRIYIFTSDAGIYLYDGDGSFFGSVPYGFSGNVQVRGTADGSGGRFFICMGKEEDPGHTILAEVDFEGKQLAEIGILPDIRGFCAAQPAGEDGGQYDFFLYDHAAVYGCGLSAAKEGRAGDELFAWLDGDINGYFVENFGRTGDGRYYAMVEDWENDDRRAVLLRQMKAEEAPRREYMVLASVNGDSTLNAMAVRFNKGNDKYHLSVKNYETLTDLYNAILAKETMDLIDLSGVNVEKLSRQGVFEDLAPYVEQSNAFGQADFLEGILDVYTFEGVLAGIPESFTLRTVVGDRRQIGDERGLSLEGMLKAAGDAPGAQVFDGVTKEEMMQYIMMFNEEAFIDRDTGECRFDSDLFKEILEFVNHLPDTKEAGGEEVSLPKKIRDGRVLFTIADLNELRGFQPYEWMYGEDAACVGFPTVDGRGGTLLFTQNAFGIVANSANKGGAWEFIEGVLKREEPGFDEGWYFCFPSLQRKLNKMIDAQMERESQYDEDRFPSLIFEDGTEIAYHALTWDEVNVAMGLLKEAKPFFDAGDDAVTKIINEEASGYYSGQKGIAETVNVIQNRVQLYVNENT